MHAFFTLSALHSLMWGGVLAVALLLTGCAVPVADPYGYDGPAYPSAPYVGPAEPAYLYGAPPVFLGGQVWIDSGPARHRHGWRDSGRRPVDRHPPPWLQDRPGNHAHPRPHDHQRPPIAGEPDGRHGPFGPDNRRRPQALDRGSASRMDRSPPGGRERGSPGDAGGGRWRGHR